MFVVAIQTARGGSKSVPGKNEMLINGKPLFLHNIDYALAAKEIDAVYMTTDIDVKNFSESRDFGVIERPNSLQGDDASHHETMVHALSEIEKERGKKIDIVVVLLGNNLSATSQDLDLAIQKLKSSPELDSVMSVSEFDMFNPFRAYKESEGMLTTIVEQDFIAESAVKLNVNDKAAAGKIFFFNGSFWVMKREALVEGNGLLPFPWLGKKIAPFYQEVTMEIDAPWQVEVVRRSAGGESDA